MRVICSAKCTADVIVVLDTSTSVGWSGTAHIRSFMTNLTDLIVANLNVGGGRIPLGMVTYSTWVRQLFRLGQHADVSDIRAAISRFIFYTGASKTHLALSYVRRYMLRAGSGARNDAPKVVIVLTDGKSSDVGATKVKR